MNYGKKGSKKRQAELTSKGIMYGKKMRVIFCKVLLVCCFAVAIIGGSLGFGVYKGILDSAPSIDDIDATMRLRYPLPMSNRRDLQLLFMQMTVKRKHTVL